jgi:hypothetical protein
MHHADRSVISFGDVMAFTGPASAQEDAVGPVRKSPDDEFQIDSSGAHHPDDPDMRRVLIARNSGEVRACVAAPVAQEPNDFRLEFIRSHS